MIGLKYISFFNWQSALSFKLSAFGFKLSAVGCWLMAVSKKPIAVFNIQILLLILFSFCKPFSIKGQDIHYTQFTLQPFQQSPAFAGDFDGNIRFGALYRNQWSTVNVPYNTIGFSFDAKVLETKKIISFLGIGSALFFDQAGDSKLQSIYAQIPISYNLYLPIQKNSSIKIGAGIYAGFLRKSIQVNKLSFDSQFIGELYDPNLPINENFSQLKFLKPDIGLGYQVAFNIKQRFELGMGFGMHHVNTIEQTFLNNGLGVKLQKRYALTNYMEYKFNVKWTLRFNYIFQEQKAFSEHQFGLIASYYIKNDGPAKTAIEVGVYHRFEDAVNVILRYRKNNFLTGFSYDFNVSKLRPATNTYGGMEVGLVYTFKKLKETDMKNKRKCFVF